MKQRFRAAAGPASAYTIARPPYRRLRIFAFDPSLSASIESAGINLTTIEIPWETYPADGDTVADGPAPGPIGDYIEVIDYDPASDTYYKPVDLNDPYLLAQDGLTPSDGNPQFHQQMVYAVAMRTIGNFELALGRRALWSAQQWTDDSGQLHESFVRRLRIYPHALRAANAFYSPDKKALLFGYFRASPKDPAAHVSGAIVFNCLSHDVIAHETAHALLDGMHRHLIEPTNADVLAFHEAFADIVALFQHFTFPQVLRNEIAQTRGHLDSDNRLVRLAQEFGQATGQRGALRSAIGDTPDPARLGEVLEPHRRGSILVAAVFDVFLAIYRNRTADLIRLATHGSGVLPEGALHPDLVARLAQEAVKSSGQVLRMCIRALDYLPPADITFGDYLQAIITADFDLVPNDDMNYRVAFMEAFRRRGIFPVNVRSMSEQSLRWEEAGLHFELPEEINFAREIKAEVSQWDLSGDREEIYERLERSRTRVHDIIELSRKYQHPVTAGLALQQVEQFAVHSLRPVRRSGPDGQVLLDVVVNITQRIPGYFDRTLRQCLRNPEPGEIPDFWFRGGCTLIVDVDAGRIRYCIFKRLDSERRFEQQKEFLGGRETSPSLAGTYFEAAGYRQPEEIFALLHQHYYQPELP